MVGQEQGSDGNLAFKLFLFGFLLVFLGVVVLIVAALFGGGVEASGAVILFVGPVPIILGAGPYSFFAILLAVVLTVIGFVVFVWTRKKAGG